MGSGWHNFLQLGGIVCLKKKHDLGSRKVLMTNQWQSVVHLLTLWKMDCIWITSTEVTHVKEIIPHMQQLHLFPERFQRNTPLLWQLSAKVEIPFCFLFSHTFTNIV